MEGHGVEEDGTDPAFPVSAPALAAGIAAAVGAGLVAGPAQQQRRQLDATHRRGVVARAETGRRRQTQPHAMALARAGLDAGGAGAGRAELAAGALACLSRQ